MFQIHECCKVLFTDPLIPLRLSDKPNLSNATIHVKSLLGTSALNSIRQANMSIQQALVQKRTVGLQRANQILSQAYQAYSTGDYASAESLAQLAEQLADASTSETTNLISSSTNLTSAVTGQGTLWPQTNLVIAVCIATILVIATIALTRKRH